MRTLGLSNEIKIDILKDKDYMPALNFWIRLWNCKISVFAITNIQQCIRFFSYKMRDKEIKVPASLCNKQHLTKAQNWRFE